MLNNLVYIDTPKVAERDRFSPYPMLQVHKALSIILGSIQPMKKRHLVNLHAGSFKVFSKQAVIIAIKKRKP